MAEEGLQTPDGKPVDIDSDKVERDFARVMSTPPGDIPPPPKKPVTEKPAKPRRGRPPKTERPRVAPAAPDSQKSDKDFTEEIGGIATGVWLCAASLPPTQAYAALVKLNQPALVASLNQGAQNNAQIRGYVEKLSTGSGGMWMVSLGVTTANMAMQALQLMRSPELRRQMQEQTKADLKAYLAEAGVKPLEEAKPDEPDPD